MLWNFEDAINEKMAPAVSAYLSRPEKRLEFEPLYAARLH